MRKVGEALEVEVAEASGRGDWRRQETEWFMFARFHACPGIEGAVAEALLDKAGS